MSHIRNLFHEPSGSASYPLQDSHVAVAQAGAPPPAAAADHLLLEFPVEEAHISSASRLVFQADPSSMEADRFRFLRMRLREHWTAGKLKKLLVTSPLPRDGKSTVLMNLATALVERGKRSVLVIEADLHHSSLADSLKLNPRAGLTECLQDLSISPLSHIRRLEPLGWHLLPAGEPRRNPTELLQTPAMGVILQKLSTCFDWVLIDSPPVVPLTDAIALQQHADGSLLVVRAGRTPREALEQTIAILGKGKIVGIVMNGVERRNQRNFQQRYYGRGRNQDHED
jgi:capsular exopolysaccharide synthesis family protein